MEQSVQEDCEHQALEQLRSLREIKQRLGLVNGMNDIVCMDEEKKIN